MFDSLALLAFLRGEKGADRVHQVLEEVGAGATNGFLSVVNLAEVYYIAWREQGGQAARAIRESIRQWGVRLVPVDEELAVEAAKIKAANALSLADAFCVATAHLVDGVVMTDDPEIRRLDGVAVLEFRD